MSVRGWTSTVWSQSSPLRSRVHCRAMRGSLEWCVTLLSWTFFLSYVQSSWQGRLRMSRWMKSVRKMWECLWGHGEQWEVDGWNKRLEKWVCFSSLHRGLTLKLSCMYLTVTVHTKIKSSVNIDTSFFYEWGYCGGLYEEVVKSLRKILWTLAHVTLSHWSLFSGRWWEEVGVSICHRGECGHICTHLTS